jgi:hypothetical protein
MPSDIPAVRRFHQLSPPSGPGLRYSKIPERDSYPLPEFELHKWTREHFDKLGFDAALIGDDLKLDGDKKPDLLCIDKSGAVGIIEFKRDMADREVLAQVMEYNFLLSEILRSESNFNSLVWNGRTIAEHYRERFGKDIPLDRSKDPFIAIIAESFERSFADMIQHFNGFHNLSITLISHTARKRDDELSYTFETILRPDDQAPEKSIPERTYVCRFNEAKRGHWNKCFESEQITLPHQDVITLQAASKSGPVTLFVDVVRAGYVAVTKLEHPFPVYKASDPNLLTIHVEWKHGVNRNQAIHRRGIFRAKESLHPLTDLGAFQYITNHFRRLQRQKMVSGGS